jgi:predicted nucleic acid-binding protein
MKALLDGDPGMAVWWGSRVECWSEFARLRRDGLFSVEGEDEARQLLSALHESWLEILPSEEVRTQAGRLLRVHAIRAAHALQLAAALAWRGDSPSGEIVAYDHRLREAARLENLILRP